MNCKLIVSVLFFLIAGLPSVLLGETCQSTDPIGTLCTLHVDKIRPTQFAVGFLAVACKAQKISKKSKKKLKKYLAKRRVPAVVGSSGIFYLTDRHHLSTALSLDVSSKWENKSKILNIEIIDNFAAKNASWDEFWAAMKKEYRVYNYDDKGIPNMNFALLPHHVNGLLNDPYRTLSRWVRESCGYVKAGKDQCDNIRIDHEHKNPFFMEFYWGDFFRQHLPLTIKKLEICKSIPYSEICLKDEVAQLKAIYSKSMELAASRKAKKYFEDLGLEPWDYGYNPSGKHLLLEWDGEQKACEEPIEN
jgi:hypothetical protein